MNEGEEFEPDLQVNRYKKLLPSKENRSSKSFQAKPERIVFQLSVRSNDLRDQIGGTGRVTCFVIIPANDLNQIAIHFSAQAVKDV